MAETTKDQSIKKPQDRSPKSDAAAERKAQAEQLKKSQAAADKLMSTGVDFSPFKLDVGDGREWSFQPDPMPAQTEALSQAMTGLGDPGEGGMTAAFDRLVEAIRALLVDEKDRADFPLPMYGSNSLMFFGLRIATGRDGFPTESA